MTGERILVVEDDAAVARGLSYALEQEGYEVHVAKTGADAVTEARTGDPAVVLLDVRLPDLSGFDICRTLRREGHRFPILMLTARDEPVDRILGLELGADDYIVKPYHLRELISRIRASLRRAYGDLAAPDGESAAPLRFGEIEIDPQRLQVRRAGELVELTPIEFRLLRFLAAHPGRPFSRSELIESVWGYESGVQSDRTVDVHVRHLRMKLEEDPSEPRWLRTVRGVGYKLAVRPPETEG